MSKVLEERNSEIIKEFCAHHLTRNYLSEDCKKCQADYDEGHHPNNYDCENYKPFLQIDYELVVKKLDGNLTDKAKEDLKIWVGLFNNGLINYSQIDRVCKLSLKKMVYDLTNHFS